MIPLTLVFPNQANKHTVIPHVAIHYPLKNQKHFNRNYFSIITTEECLLLKKAKYGQDSMIHLTCTGREIFISIFCSQTYT